jgi:hypothetical protein
MWSKKWYLKRNISCDAHLLNELLETDVPWDDAIVLSADKLSKLWDFLSELRSSLCERRLERTVLRPALLPVKTAQFTQFFRQVWHQRFKSFSLTEGVYGALLVVCRIEWVQNTFDVVGFKVLLSFVMSVRVYRRCFCWTRFRTIWYWKLFRKPAKKENCTLLGYYAQSCGIAVISYHYSLRNNPEWCSSYLLRGERTEITQLWRKYSFKFWRKYRAIT